jgi:WD40 repeat protein
MAIIKILIYARRTYFFVLNKAHISVLLSSRYSYSKSGENSDLMTLKHHKKACRCLRFSNNGEELYTASKDKSVQIVDLNTGSVKHKFKRAHE